MIELQYLNDPEIVDDLNIHAEPGTKVYYTGKNGYVSDHIRYHKNRLRVNETYTIERIDIGGWSSNVYLKEFPNVPVNSVVLREASKLTNQTQGLE